MIRRAEVILAIAVTAAFALTACQTSEPTNLSDAKAVVLKYVDSGEYAREIERVSLRAEQWIQRRARLRKPGERLAVVFDLDETLLSNLSHMRSIDFGYIKNDWDRWVDSAAAPAVKPAVNILSVAEKENIAVFLLTARDASRDRPGTEANLRAAGIGGYERLILVGDASSSATAEERKSVARRKLSEEGWTVIASVGDQWSDLRGGNAERVFKLPNPFYRTP